MNAPIVERKSNQQIQSETIQLENQLDVIRKEYESLKRQNELLQAEMDQKRTDYESYISGREKQYRDGMAQLAVDNKTLEVQRGEFRDALDLHLKEKADFGQEKINFLKEKSAIDGKRRLVEDFIQSVKRAYNVLP